MQAVGLEIRPHMVGAGNSKQNDTLPQADEKTP